MAGEELLADGNRRVLAALLFMGAGTMTMDAYSALNSSPWTAESFGGDPAKAASCREYVLHAIVVSGIFGVTAGVVAENWWPIIGTVAADVYMFWLYERALGRALASGSQSWGDAGQPTSFAPFVERQAA